MNMVNIQCAIFSRFEWLCMRRLCVTSLFFFLHFSLFLFFLSCSTLCNLPRVCGCVYIWVLFSFLWRFCCCCAFPFCSYSLFHLLLEPLCYFCVVVASRWVLVCIVILRSKTQLTHPETHKSTHTQPIFPYPLYACSHLFCNSLLLFGWAIDTKV